MKFTIIEPPLPSFSWYRGLRSFGSKKTILRQMEYDRIKRISLEGRVLDFGGGRTAEYSSLLKGASEISSVNISDEFQPTHTVMPGEPLPFDDETFNAVVTFSTLEHVHDDLGALAEITRVLAPLGSLHVIVPFIYPVHGHPDDFNRHTPSWWQHALAHAGYREACLTPLIFGRTTASRLIRGRGPTGLRPLTDFVAATRDILLAKLLFAGSTTYTGRQGERIWASSPAWYIAATK